MKPKQVNKVDKCDNQSAMHSSIRSDVTSKSQEKGHAKKKEIKRKIIFLDVDGVLCSARCNNKTSLTDETKVELVRDPNNKCSSLELSNLDNLKRLVNLASKKGEAKIEIVISSSWRHQAHLREFLVSVLKDYGLEVTGDTPFIKAQNAKLMMWGNKNTVIERRGEEVKKWLIEN